MPRRVPALLSDLGSDTQCPTPSPSELLTARAVQQLHDPQAVVQQSFGPHWLQASWGTQEGQHCFHLGADLHTLKGRKPLGPQVPPPACEEIPGELWGAGWWWLSCLEEGQEIPVTRTPESHFSPAGAIFPGRGSLDVPHSSPTHRSFSFPLLGAGQTGRRWGHPCCSSPGPATTT